MDVTVCQHQLPPTTSADFIVRAGGLEYNQTVISCGADLAEQLDTVIFALKY
jgi:hypothetical protein